MNPSKLFAPMLSAPLDDVNLETLRYPFIVSPKLDGIRCIIKDGIAYTRNLKPVRNDYVRKCLAGLPNLDGELIVGSPTHSLCMNNTQSGIMSIKGEPDFGYYVFDTYNKPEAGFESRLSAARAMVEGCGKDRVYSVPHVTVDTYSDLLAYEQDTLNDGYEGVMLRAANGPYKYGRSTLREGYLMKLKRFIDGEATVVGIEEAMENLNPLTRDALGRAKRSHHQENKEGKAMVGVIWADSPKWGRMRLSPGTMNHNDRTKYFVSPETLIGKSVHWRAFGYGMKDTPRFPRFYGLREDI